MLKMLKWERGAYKGHFGNRKSRYGLYNIQSYCLHAKFLGSDNDTAVM